MPRRSAAAAAFSSGSTAVSRVRPPADLTGPERVVFLATVLACSSDHFQVSDLPLLTAYCRAVVLEKVASSELAAAGYVNAGKPSALLPVLAQATRSLTVHLAAVAIEPRCPTGGEIEAGSCQLLRTSKPDVRGPMR